MSNNGTISRYKARWIVKRYEKQKGIYYTKIFSPVAKSYSISILFALVAYYGWFIKNFDAVITYFNSNIDVLLYVKLLNGYKQPSMVTLLRKTIYGLK